MAGVKTAHDVLDELVDRQGADLGRHGGIHDDSSSVVSDNPYYATSMPTFFGGFTLLHVQFRVIFTLSGSGKFDPTWYDSPYGFHDIGRPGHQPPRRRQAAAHRAHAASPLPFRRGGTAEAG